MDPQNKSFDVKPSGSTQPILNTPPSAPAQTTVIGPQFMNPSTDTLPVNNPMSPVSTPMSFSQSSKSGNKKKGIMIGSLAGLILLLGLGSYFFLYVPNTPSNVWSTGLNRSGKALSKITETATNKENIDKILKTQVTATIDGKVGGTIFNGSLDTKFDDAKSNTDLKFKTDANGKNINLGLKLLSEIPKDKQFPNIYFQFYGLKDLGLDSSYSQFTDYDSKWISVDSSYLEKNISQADLPKTTTKQQITAKEIVEVAKAFNDINGQYVFTAEKSKAIFVEKSFVAKETVDGVSAYHYVVGIDANNAKTYCKAMVEKMVTLDAVKKTVGTGDTIDNVKKDGLKSCDEIKSSDKTFDMWMDSKYKLIYKARFTNDKDKKSYVDIGQLYKGGDDLNIFINSHDENSKSDAKFSLSSNIKTNVSSGSLTIGSSSPDSSYDVKIAIKAAPFDGTINVDKPADTISIEEILTKLGIDPVTVQSSAKNTERKTDLKAISSHLETFNAINGSYPSLSEVNDASFRAKNFKGLDLEAFKDPSGTDQMLTSTPVLGVSYGYSATPAGCKSTGTNLCVSFTLTAKLDDGEADYVVKDLNSPVEGVQGAKTNTPNKVTTKKTPPNQNVISALKKIFR